MKLEKVNSGLARDWERKPLTRENQLSWSTKQGGFFHCGSEFQGASTNRLVQLNNLAINKKQKRKEKNKMRKQFRSEEIKKQAKRELIEAQLTYGFFLATFAATILMIFI